jgi:hypothetical protein
MYVRMISFGSNWWAARHVGKEPAWFNSAGLRHGSRTDFCWICEGQVRFNRSSGFHPEFRQRAIGTTFFCENPRIYDGRIHLLVTNKASTAKPDGCLVTVTDCIHGQICFDTPDWRSPGVQPISISRKQDRYEAVLLMRPNCWVKSDVGRWQASCDSDRLLLLPHTGEATA